MRYLTILLLASSCAFAVEGECSPIIDVEDQSYCYCAKQRLPANCSRGEVIEQCREAYEITCTPQQMDKECDPNYCNEVWPSPALVNAPWVEDMMLRLPATHGTLVPGAQVIHVLDHEPNFTERLVAARNNESLVWDAGYCPDATYYIPMSCGDGTDSGCEDELDSLCSGASQNECEDGTGDYREYDDGSVACFCTCAPTDGTEPRTAFKHCQNPDTIVDEPEPVGATDEGQTRGLE